MRAETDPRLQKDGPAGDPLPQQAAVPEQSSAHLPPVDFHSPEFNRIDDLNDCSGNYRSFAPLDGVVTAHERHQVERGRHAGALDPTAHGLAPARNPAAGQNAAPVDETAEPLSVISKGRTLIIDTDAQRGIACGRSLAGSHLFPSLLVVNASTADNPLSRRRGLSLLEVENVSITGAFGNFSATVTVKGKRRPLADRLGPDAASFDLVLDLQPVPAYAGESLPIGYYAPGSSPSALDAALAELPEMRGRFRKPRFVSVMKAQCLHGRSRVRECRRCIDICPFSAIQSVGKAISVNHQLCQGCGGCALVCPADAVHTIDPPPQEILDTLRATLDQARSRGLSAPTLVISDQEPLGDSDALRTGEGDSGQVVRFTMEHIAHARLGILLEAFVHRAGAVVVACSLRNPPGIRQAVERQVRKARAILKGLGLPEEACTFTLATPAETVDAKPVAPDGRPGHRAVVPASGPVDRSGSADHHTLVRRAAQYLYDRSSAMDASLALPSGSPFGTVFVDTACTSCMACAAACPTGALSSDGDSPRLMFQESRCHQCGLCKETCPEAAIRLLPRLCCDPGAVEDRRIVLDAEAIRCIECGRPFASSAMIDRVRERLSGHWMYASERQRRRLQMCRDCSARDALAAMEARQ